MTQNEGHLLLVDGTAFIFRAYYAIKTGLTNKQGEPTNAVMGFKNMILNLFKTQSPSHVAMVFDASGKSFRNEIYPEYKANRGAPPEDLVPQFDFIFELADCMNLKIMKIDGYEADDVIGSLAKLFGERIKTTIVSGDKDLTQLVTQKTHMLDPMKNLVYTPAEVKKKFGVPPEKIAEYLALVGDSSDNIPGAKGVGPKTAGNLFETYGDLNQILAHVKDLKGKLKEKVEDSRENIELSLKLTRIEEDMDLDCELEEFELQQPDQERLAAFYERMSFRPDELVTVDVEAVKQEDASPLDRSIYELVTDEARLEALIQKIHQTKLAAMDFETTSLNAVEARIVGISFAAEGIDPFYVPLGHETETPQISLDKALSIIQPLFEDPKMELVGQNIKYEMLVLANYSLELKCVIHDSMLQSYLLEAEQSRHNLDDLSERHLGHKTIHYEEVAGKGKKQIPFEKVGLEEALRYAAEDSDVTLRLHQKLFPRLQAEGLLELYRDTEIPLSRVLAKMESVGVKIDEDALGELKDRLSAEIEELTQKIYEEAGEEFNLNSTQQLGAILFDKLGVKIGKKKTKTGYSTDQKTLSKMAATVPLAKLMLGYRTRTKLINTYLDVLPKLIYPRTGRVHTSFVQTRAATGRLSSINPNLQNIPVKGAEGASIRRAFTAEPCSLIVSADYSQIELRILAHLSEDENLIQVFEEGKDIHSSTAAAVFGVEQSEVDEDQRRAAKAINFGIIYGMGAYSLSQEIGVSNKEAKDFIEAYYARFPRIGQFQEKTIESCRKLGYVTTMLGRRRRIPDIGSKNHMARTGAERVAINTPIQGSAADLIKSAMIQAQKWIDTDRVPAQMVMQVHDELVFEVVENEVEGFILEIKRIMETAHHLKVPLEVDVDYGKNWYEAH